MELKSIMRTVAVLFNAILINNSALASASADSFSPHVFHVASAAGAGAGAGTSTGIGNGTAGSAAGSMSGSSSTGSAATGTHSGRSPNFVGTPNAQAPAPTVNPSYNNNARMGGVVGSGGAKGTGGSRGYGGTTGGYGGSSGTSNYRGY